MDPLLARYRETRSPEAFREIVNRYTNAVYSQCLRQTRRCDMAEDVTQAVFVLLAQKATDLKPGVVLEGWLFNTARYGCLNALRMQRRRKHYEQAAAAIRPETAGAGAAGELEPKQMLDTVLAKLSQADREAVVLRYYGDKSIAEVAQALGTSVDAAKQRVSRAVERMRKIYAKQGVAAPALLLPDVLAKVFAEPAPAYLASQSAGAALGSATVPSSVSTIVVALGKAQLAGKAMPLLAAALFLFAVVNMGWFLWPRSVPRPPQEPRDRYLMNRGAAPGWGKLESVSPRDVLDRLARALESGDDAEVWRQVTVKAPDDMDVAKAVVRLGMARDALKSLWRQKYGDAEKWPKLQWLSFGEIVGGAAMAPDPVVLHQMWPGEVMIYLNGAPEPMFGANGRTPVGQRWAHGSFAIRQDRQDWKVDLDGTLAMVVTGVPPVPHDPTATLRRQVASIEACTRVMRDTAEQVRAGKFASSTEAMDYLLGQIEQSMRDLGTPGMEFGMYPRS